MNGEGRVDIGGIYMDTDGYGKREERREEEVSEPIRIVSMCSPFSCLCVPHIS